MVNFIDEKINEYSKFYNVVKVFFEINPQKIDLERSSLSVDEFSFKLNLYSIGNFCCPIGYEVLDQGDKLNIKLVIDDWEGAFDTDFEIKKDVSFLDEKYLRAVLGNEIIIDNYYSLDTNDKQKSIIVYYENLTGNEEVRKIKFGTFGLFGYIDKKKYEIKKVKYDPWLSKE